MLTPEFRRELSVFFKLAIPLIVQSAIDDFCKMLTVIFAGKFLTTEEFDSVALGITMTNITGYSMIHAFASPMDSLCTQANGAGQWKLFSVTVYRALICSSVFLIPTVVLWLTMDKLLILCDQNPSIAANVAQFTLIYISILPAFVIRTISERFLSSQGISRPHIIMGTFCCIWHPISLYFVFVVLSKREFIWAPICNIITTYIGAIGMLGYIVIIKPHHPKSLQKVSLSAIFRWKTSVDILVLKNVPDKGMSEYIRLLIAGIFSICASWWSYEIITILMGLLGATQLAVHVIFATLSDAAFVIPYGIAFAGASRIGTLTGENRLHLARRLGNVILCFTLFEGLIMAMVSFVVKAHIPRLFTSDPAVIDIATEFTPLFCLYVVLAAVYGSFQGILRGIKRQGKSAIAVVIGTWLIAIPVACLLAFTPQIGWGIFGMWTGHNAGYMVMNILFLSLWIRYGWKPQGKDNGKAEPIPLAAMPEYGSVPSKSSNE